ncbi:MAG: TolC family protein [Gammaproteobacteria bacterium]|nr:TolC family protein [Gammaproteobacteria bacterium]
MRSINPVIFKRRKPRNRAFGNTFGRSAGYGIRVLLATALPALCTAQAVAAPTNPADVPITENEALALFYQRNLELIAAHFKIAQSQAQEVIAAALPNPVFSLNVLEIDGSGRLGNDGAGPGVGVAVTELLETAGKRRIRRASGALGTQSAEADLKDATRTLSAGVRRAYYALLLAQKNVTVAQDTVDQYAQIVIATEFRLKHGDVAESDVWRLKVEAYKARADSLSQGAAVDKARADLASLLRWPVDAMHFVARAEWPVLRQAVTEDRDSLFTEAMTRRPDLAAANKRAEQSKQELTLAERTAIPDVTVGAGYLHDINNLNHDTANFSVSVPLPLFYRNQGEIQKSAVSMNAAALEVEQLQLTIRKEIVGGLAAWQSAEAIARGFERDVLKQVQKIRDGAEVSYQKGGTSILDLLDAQRNYREVMHDYQVALYNRTIAGIDLQAALASETAK